MQFSSFSSIDPFFFANTRGKLWVFKGVKTKACGSGQKPEQTAKEAGISNVQTGLSPDAAGEY